MVNSYRKATERITRMVKTLTKSPFEVGPHVGQPSVIKVIVRNGKEQKIFAFDMSEIRAHKEAWLDEMVGVRFVATDWMEK